MKSKLVLTVSLLLFLFSFTNVKKAYAACVNPPGVEGQQVYNTTYKTMQFCDGTRWWAMKGGGGGSGGSGGGGTSTVSDNTVISNITNSGTGVQYLSDGIIDQFTDETGVDVGFSSGQIYNAAGDLYNNGAALGASAVAAFAFEGDYSDALGGSALSVVSGTGGFSSVTVKSGAQSFEESTASEAWLQMAAAQNPAAGSTSYVIEAWFYIPSSGFAGTNDLLSSRDLGFNSGFALRSGSNQGLQIHQVSGGAGGPGARLTTGTAGDVPLDQWVHLALEQDSTVIRGYVDGVLKTSTTSSVIPHSSNNRWTSPANGVFIDDAVFRNAAVYGGASFTPLGPLLLQNITLLSQPFTAAAQSNKARIMLFHEPVDAVTLNTDVKAFVSRDGGTTWTQGTLSNQGAFNSTTNVLATTVDLSAQPAGTAMKYKIQTFNAKEQKFHAVSLRWGSAI